MQPMEQPGLEEAGDGHAATLHQDARVYAGLFDGPEHAALAITPGRLLYVHVARGSVSVNGEVLGAGDALKLTEVTGVELADGNAAEVLVFDLPGPAN